MNGSPNAASNAVSFSADDRALLRRSIRSLLQQHWPAADAIAYGNQRTALDRVWMSLAEHGMTSLARGGADGGWTESLIAIEELGRAACPAPLIDTALGHCLRWPELSGVLAAGDMQAAFVFATDGHATHTASSLTGYFPLATVLPSTSHFCIALRNSDHAMLALVDRQDPGIELIEQPGLAPCPLASLRLRGAAARVRLLEANILDQLMALARLGYAARAAGAARKAFELVVEHAKTRRQFGRAIGQFQAIQHKLADGLIALEATAHLLENAGTAIDRQASNWPLATNGAVAFAGPALQRLELEVQHSFGAIGFSEEHEAPRHFRRVFADLTQLGGARSARKELARQFVDTGASLADLDLGEAANSFRHTVREWLAVNWNEATRQRERSRPFGQRGVDPEFSRLLGQKGWIGLSWPLEHGGLGLSPLEQFVFMEEMARAGAPLGAHSCASEMIGPALIAFGTEAQKQQFLPAFLRGEIIFSLGYSESEAGSDLANLRLQALRDGDDWILTGEKLWTSRGDIAHYHWLAARTDTAATPPQAGISVFMVPLNSPGISIRTSQALHGHSFSSIRYDQVRIPDSARVGDVNAGWKIITHALAAERVVMGSYVAVASSLFDDLVKHVRTGRDCNGNALRSDAVLRDRIGALGAEIEAARLLAVQGVRIVARGGVPVCEAAMSKVYSGDLLQRLVLTAIDLLGPQAALSEEAPLAIVAGRIEQQLRRSIMMVVGGGSAEIQRNIIATRRLELPR